MSNFNFKLPIITNSLKAKVTHRTKNVSIVKDGPDSQGQTPTCACISVQKDAPKMRQVIFMSPLGKTIVYIAPSFHLICAIFYQLVSLCNKIQGPINNILNIIKGVLITLS